MKGLGSRVGIDVGGTFTDFVLTDERAGRLVFHKEPSTPADPADAVARGLAALLAKAGLGPDGLDLVIHGTTLALNAIVQRRGAPVALVVSEGNRDVLEIARLRMASSVDFTLTKEAPLVPRNRAFTLPARQRADGTVVRQPTEADLDALADALREAGVAAVAVMLLHSYLYPELERQVTDGLRRRLPGLLVSASADVWPEMREYERALVTVLNAYVSPLMDGYLARLTELTAALGLTAPINVTTSNGGAASLAAARARPIDTVLSGPASGVVAAARTAARGRHKHLITFDMGGTSSDVALVGAGEPEYTTRATVGDFPLVMPVVAVSSIGAGGGSILWVDPQGVLKVGPRSAGAAPGPVCYGRGGTEATLTDCYVAVGWIDPDSFLGGRMRLDRAAAERALGEIAVRMGITGEDRAARVAAAALRVATAVMATELYKQMAQRGEDPSAFALMPFGGAGPTHAGLLAEEARLPAIVVPPSPGTFCALGAVLADVKRDWVRSLRLRLVGEDATDRLRLVVVELSAEATAWLATETLPLVGHTVTGTADMRYVGQSFDLTTDLDEALVRDPTAEGVTEAFHRAHEKVYGFRDEDSAVEIASLRIRVSGRLAPVVTPETATRTAPLQLGRRRVFDADGWRDIAVVQRRELGRDDTLTGPLIVDQEDSTAVVPQGWQLVVDGEGNLIVTRVAAAV